MRAGFRYCVGSKDESQDWAQNSATVGRTAARRSRMSEFCLPSAVNLKFLSLLAASSFRNFKFKTALES